MKHLLATSAVVFAFGTPVYAQSSDELFDLIENGISTINEDGAGLSIGARERGDDGSLVLRDIVLQPEDEDFTVSAEFLSIKPSAEEPGEVLITVSDVVTFDVAPDDGAPLEIVLTSSGLEVVTNWVEDMAGNPVVSIAAGTLAVTGGSEDHPILQALNVDMDDLSFRFEFDGATRSFDGAFSVARLGAIYEFLDPTVDMLQAGDLQYSSYEMAFSGDNLPEDESGLDMFVDQNGAFNLSGGAGPATFDTRIESDEFPVSISGSAEAGTFEISLKEGVLAYVADTGGFIYNVAVSYPGLPLPPFELAAGELGMDFRIPMRQADGPQPVNADLSISDLTISEALWGLIDPEGTIPRDPANLNIDLGATVEILAPVVESLDEDGVDDAGNPMEVAQVSDVDITTVYLNAGGAEVAADGSLVVNNAGPFPMPEGAINVSLKGIQGLVNSLTELGLVGAQEAGMAMGMMMAFAKPGEEPDSFTSEIEFKDGGVTANGIPLQ